jgi:hypothetical protein
LTIAKDAILDENHLNGQILYFSVEVNLLLFFIITWDGIKMGMVDILSYLGIL